MQTFPRDFVAGDTLPSLVGKAPFDITGYTITLSLKRPSDLLIKTATITGAVTGDFIITWLSTDLVVGDRQVGEVHFVAPGGATLTAPKFLLNVISRNA